MLSLCVLNMQSWALHAISRVNNSNHQDDSMSSGNAEALSSLMSLLAGLLGPVGIRQGAVVLHLARLFAPLVFGASNPALEQQPPLMQEALAQVCLLLPHQPSRTG